MKKLLTVLLAVICFAGIASGAWVFDSRIVDYNVDSLTYKFTGEISGTVRRANQPHGVAVDSEGKIWVALYGAEGVHEGVNEFDWKGSTSRFRPFYVYDDDGTLLHSISVFELPGGELDTIHSMSPINGAKRGIYKDAYGYIHISSWATVYRFDPVAMECNGRFVPPILASLTDVTHDPGSGLYLVGHVGAGNPVHIFDEDMEYIGDAVDALPSLQRSICLRTTDDGWDLMVGGIYPGNVYKYQTLDIEFEQFEVVDTLGRFVEEGVTYNLWAECLDWMPDGKLLVGNTRVSEYPNPRNHLWTILDVDNNEILGDFGNPVVVGEYDPLAIPDGATNSPRNADWVGENVMYLADMTLNTIDKWVWSETSVHQLDLPENFKLSQNYPNPLNPSTTIEFSINTPANVILAVYNMKGQLVETLVSEHKNTGSYKVVWNADNMPSGTYVYRLQVGNEFMTKKMVLLK